MTSRTAGRAYLRRLVPAMIGYVVVLIICIPAARAVGTSWWRYPLTVLPLLPLILVVRAVIRYLAEADELQRRIQLEALAFAFGVGSLLTFGYGLLQGVGVPVLAWVWVWPVYAICWMLGLGLARWRYR